jgi:hypothetical protein
MIKTFTQNDILRFVYEETQEEENVLIANVLLTNNELYNFYQEVLAVKKDVDQIYVQPSDTIIGNILAYSRSFVVR